MWLDHVDDYGCNSITSTTYSFSDDQSNPGDYGTIEEYDNDSNYVIIYSDTQLKFYRLYWADPVDDMCVLTQYGGFATLEEARTGTIGETIFYAYTSVSAISPVILLNGDNPLELAVDSTFTDPGAVVKDWGIADETITALDLGGLNTAVSGSYTITYTKTDINSNTAVPVTRTVEVISAATYTVTYNGNGSDGGTVPSDSNNYEAGSTVTVASAGTMIRSGYTFAEWNTAANGSGTPGAAGSSFTMGTANVPLYAQWTANPTYTVTYYGNGSDGGVVPTDSNSYEEGATVTVASAGTMTLAGYTFAGWSLTVGGSVDYVDGAIYTMGAENIIMYAIWINIEKKLTASDGAADDIFGRSVAVSPDGNTIVISTTNDDYEKGAIYIFQYDGSDWNETKLTASDGGANDRFGVEVSISSDHNTICVGASYDNAQSGAV